MKLRVSRLGPSFKAILPLLLLGGLECTFAQPPGAFSPAGNMTTVRAAHTATLLLDGRVLIAGGTDPNSTSLAGAELYDPSAGTFTTTGRMTTGRQWHTATLLANGKVLIAGGIASNQALSSAELYDPTAGTFTPTGSMTTSRGAFHTATLLADGRVLIAGGKWNSAPPYVQPSDGTSAELYDPSTETFAPTGTMNAFHFAQTATLLPDGKVLIAEGVDRVLSVPLGGSELYDPIAGEFRRLDPEKPALNPQLYWHTATLLLNGKVLIAGGQGPSELAMQAAKVYVTSVGAFTPASDLTTPRQLHTGTLLSDGTVLIIGSQATGGDGVSSTELYDLRTESFTSAPALATGRSIHAATLLNDGNVLVTGGIEYFPFGSAGRTPSVGVLSSAELYRAVFSTPVPRLFSLTGDGKGQGAILHAGTARVVSSTDPAVAGEALEIYATGLIDGGAIPPQVAIGGHLAEILFFGKAPGFPDLNQVNIRVPGSVAPGAAVSVRMSYAGRHSDEVTIGVQ